MNVLCHGEVLVVDSLVMPVVVASLLSFDELEPFGQEQECIDKALVD